jgi:hypothetical protein
MSDPASHDVKNIWRNQQTEGTIVTLEDIHGRAAKFERRVKSRNIREYVAGAIVIALFGFAAWRMHGWMIELANVMTIAATLFVTWQLHRRGRARNLPDGATAAGLLAFHREELVRQRDMIRSVWVWYIAPFIPGSVMIFLARYFQMHTPGIPLAEDHMRIVLGASIAALIMVIIGLLNMWGAARLQNRIDELDKLRTE